MENDFGYIDNKPFNKINSKEQSISSISIFDKEIQFKVNDVEKYYIWDKDNYIPEVYAVDSKGTAITALNVNTLNNTYSTIPSSILSSNLFFYKINNKKLKHFTKKTKISKIEYFHDDLKNVFGNNSLKCISRLIKNKIETLSIEGKSIPNKKIGSANIENNNINFFLSSGFEYNHNYIDIETITIKYKNSLILKFKKSINLDFAYKLLLLIDATIHLLILDKKRHRKLYISDFCQNTYLLTDKKTYTEQNKKSVRKFLICNQIDSCTNFIKIFQKLYLLDVNSRNALFSIIEFDRDISSLEVRFLEYYKTLEYLDCQKQKSAGKGKNPNFLNNHLKENKEFRESIFGTQTIKEIEEEIRALRNYYSHEGYYIDELPIPTNNPKRYKSVESQWLYDVYRFIKTLTYLEVYKSCNINVKWNDITYII